MRGLSNPPNLPSLPGPPKKPQAPRFVPPHELLVSGPGDPPNGFLTGQTSLPEWWWYWGSAKVFDDPKDPRQPPFFGGRDWGYQVARMGGHTRALGAAVVDFVYWQGATLIGVRIQGERFHVYAGSHKHALDLVQRTELERNGLTVIDVYEEDFLGDPSGQKTVVAVKKAVGRLEKISPITAGTAIRASRLKVLG